MPRHQIHYNNTDAHASDDVHHIADLDAGDDDVYNIEVSYDQGDAPSECPLPPALRLAAGAMHRRTGSLRMLAEQYYQ